MVKTLEKRKSTCQSCSYVYRSISSPLGSGGSQQSWWWCRAQHWPLSQRKTSAWGSCQAAPLPSSAPSPGIHTCPHHTPDTWTQKDDPSVWWLTTLKSSHNTKVNITDVFESDDIGMLPVSHQDFDLFRRVPLNFVYYLRNMETQTLTSCCNMASVAEVVLPSAGHLASHTQHGCSIFSHFLHSSSETFTSPHSRVTSVLKYAFTQQSSNLVAQESQLPRLSHFHTHPQCNYRYWTWHIIILHFKML